jgi:hypothetical protein
MHTKHINALFGQNVEFLNANLSKPEAYCTRMYQQL